MIPRKFHFYTFSFVMSLLMSGVMSLAILLTGHLNVFEAFSHWPKTWVISMLIAFPTSLLVVPTTKKLVHRIVATK